jgi:hypothetical protein
MLDSIRSLRLPFAGAILAAALAVPGNSAICDYSATGFFSGLDFDARVEMVNITAFFTTVEAKVREAGGCTDTSGIFLRPGASDIAVEFDACGTTHVLQPTVNWQAPAGGLCSFLVYVPL